MIDDAPPPGARASSSGRSASTSIPTRSSGTSSAGQRQLTEIVKAISRNVRVLILDEPTTALSGGEVEKLFALIRRLKSEGVAIIYVSHRMDEITRIADRATILRDGRHVVTAPMSELTLDRSSNISSADARAAFPT